MWAVLACAVRKFKLHGIFIIFIQIINVSIINVICVKSTLAKAIYFHFRMRFMNWLAANSSIVPD